MSKMRLICWLLLGWLLSVNVLGVNPVGSCLDCVVEYKPSDGINTNKCGFFRTEGTNTAFFLKETYWVTNSSRGYLLMTNEDGSTYYERDMDYYAKYSQTKEYNGMCVVQCISGSGTSHEKYYMYENHEVIYNVLIDDSFSCPNTWNNGSTIANYLETNFLYYEDPYTNNETLTYTYFIRHNTNHVSDMEFSGYNNEYKYEYTNEYTDQMLRKGAMGLIRADAYSQEGWSETAATAELSIYSDGSAYGDKFKFRIGFQGEAGKSYELSYNENTKTQSGGTSSTGKSITFQGTGGIQYSPEIEVLPSEMGGTVQISNLQLRPGVQPNMTQAVNWRPGGGTSINLSDRELAGMGMNGFGASSMSGFDMETSSDCASCMQKSGAIDRGLALRIGLGHSKAGSSAGILEFNKNSLDADFLDLENLMLNAVDDESQVCRQGSLFQVMTAEGLIEVNKPSTNTMSIKVFSPVGITPVTDGQGKVLYYTNAINAIKTYTLMDVTATNATNRTIQLQVGTSSVTNNLYYDYAETNGMEYSFERYRTSKYIKEVTSQPTSTNGVTETIEKVFAPGSTTVVYQMRTLTKVFDWGSANILEEKGTGTNALQTYYYYAASRYPNYSFANSVIQPLIQVNYPDGNWIKYEYNTDGTVLRTTQPFKNSSPTDVNGVHHVVEYDYNMLWDWGDDNSISPKSPRTITEKIGTTVVKLTYEVHNPAYTRTIEWNKTDPTITDTAYLETRMDYFTSGVNSNRLQKVTRPNGTVELYDYAAASGFTTNLIAFGKLGTGGLVTDGFRWRQTINSKGQSIREQIEDMTGKVLDWIECDYDTLGFPSHLRYADGTTEMSDFTCCGLNTHTDRNGVLRWYDYDEVNRPIGYEEYRNQDRIVYTNTLDAAGNVLVRWRVGANNNVVKLEQSAYLDNGLLQVTTNQFGMITSWTQSMVGDYFCQTATMNSGQADSSTSIKYFFKDRRLSEVAGNGEHPFKYDYNVGSGSPNHMIKAVIRVGAGGSTNEWEQFYTDMLGRVDLQIMSDNSQKTFTYNEKGQLTQEMGLSGVIKYWRYNDRGEIETIATSVDGSGDLDLTADRATTFVQYATNSAGIDRWVKQTWVYATNTAVATLLRQEEWSADHLRHWDTLRVAGQDVVQRSQIYYNTNTHYRYETNIAPDNTFRLRTYYYDRLVAEADYPTVGGALGSVGYGYDEHGRLNRASDIRNGASYFEYNGYDQLTAATTPAPGNGLLAQTTRFQYDSRGTRWITTLADGTTTTNLYYPTGELKMTSGSRIYPAGYYYDAQGRMRYMTNWTTYPGTGARVTEWQYNAYRGFMTNKIDALSQGVYYAYRADGQLTNRVWSRGTPRLGTIYSYTKAGDLQKIDYADTTPDVDYGYDRQGRRTTVTRNGIVTTLVLNEAGQLNGESYAGGSLAGLSVESLSDAWLRPYQVNAKSNGNSLSTYGLSYSSTSGRLQTVTNGNYSANYSYVPNSRLVGQIDFKEIATLRMTMVKQFDKLNRINLIRSTPADSSQSLLTYGSQYNDANQRTRVSLQDGSYWIYDYDKLGQVTIGKKYFSDNTPVPGQQFEYTHDDIGNRSATKAGGDQIGQNLRPAAYVVTNANQYISRTVPGFVDIVGLANPSSTVTINSNTNNYRRGDYFQKALDINNSTTNPAVLGVNVTAGGTPQLGKLILPPATQTFLYDSDGNLTNDLVWQYQWDAENRLIQMDNMPSPGMNATNRLQLKFEYDWQGRRIMKTVTRLDTSAVILANKFLYNGWNLIAELNATNNMVIRSYVWGSDLSGTLRGTGGVGGLLMVKNGATETHFASYDLNGNLTGLINGTTGAWSANYEYSPFGELIRATGPMSRANPLRWSSKYTDDETDLIYYGYRFYSPSLGRWLSKDPLEERGGLNLYGFIGNNTVSKFDPFGLEVGFVEGLIPIWGSGKQACEDFGAGNWGWGTFNTALAISDVIPVRAAAGGAAKGVWKCGSHTWSATSKWMTRCGRREFQGQELHHWAIPQNGWGGNIPEWLKNQPWNLMLMPDEAFHDALHGVGRNAFNFGERLWYGTPGWLKAGGFSLGGREVAWYIDEQSASNIGGASSLDPIFILP